MTTTFYKYDDETVYVEVKLKRARITRQFAVSNFPRFNLPPLSYPRGMEREYYDLSFSITNIDDLNKIYEIFKYGTNMVYLSSDDDIIPEQTKQPFVIERFYVEQRGGQYNIWEVSTTILRAWEVVEE